jgi:ketosteroid isomerase-like protein
MVNAKDLDGLMMMYAEGTITMPVNEPMINDKAAIRTYQEGNMGESSAQMSFETLEVYGDENTVTEIVISRGKGSTGTQVSSGKYMVIFKKSGR